MMKQTLVYQWTQSSPQLSWWRSKHLYQWTQSSPQISLMMKETPISVNSKLATDYLTMDQTPFILPRAATVHLDDESNTYHFTQNCPQFTLTMNQTPISEPRAANSLLWQWIKTPTIFPRPAHSSSSRWTNTTPLSFYPELPTVHLHDEPNAYKCT